MNNDKKKLFNTIIPMCFVTILKLTHSTTHIISPIHKDKSSTYYLHSNSQTFIKTVKDMKSKSEIQQMLQNVSTSSTDV